MIKRQILLKIQTYWQGYRSLKHRLSYRTGLSFSTLLVERYCAQSESVLVSHEFILKDSISLIRQLECMNISQTQDVILTSADVAVLYPLINLEDGLTAMQWFMTQYTSIPLDLQMLYILLVQFVLENKYAECDCLPDAYL